MFTKYISRQDREVREVSFWGLLCGLSVLCVRQIKHSRLDLSMPCNHKTAPGQIQPSRGSLAVEKWRKCRKREWECCRLGTNNYLCVATTSSSSACVGLMWKLAAATQSSIYSKTYAEGSDTFAPGWINAFCFNRFHRPLSQHPLLLVVSFLLPSCSLKVYLL